MASVWWLRRWQCHHDRVAYFTAVLARAGSAWRARDVELDEAGTLDDLADTLRAVAVDDEPVIALLEHEDEWFALFRVDGDDEPRLFVSDLPAASLSGYAQLLAPAADIEVADEPGTVDAGDEDETDPDDDEPVVLTGEAAWAGDPELLDDLGVSGATLRRLVDEHDEDPAAVLADVGEQIGFGELLQALR